MIKISVILPAYNAEKYIGKAIDSILNQSLKDFELIIIDDDSADATYKIAERYKLQDNRIKLFKNEKNLGIAGNRNKGISLATGKYIVWQDADDISRFNRLEMQYAYMEENPLIGISGGSIEIFNEKGTLGTRAYPSEDIDIRKKIFKYSPIAQPASIIRREIFKIIGSYNLEYPPAEDLDMTFRIGEFYKLGNIDKVIIDYRDNQKSATYTSINKMERNSILIRNKYKKSKSYKVSLGDYIFFILHQISINFIPVGLKIRIFNMMRNF